MKFTCIYTGEVFSVGYGAKFALGHRPKRQQVAAWGTGKSMLSPKVILRKAEDFLLVVNRDHSSKLLSF